MFHIQVVAKHLIKQSLDCWRHVLHIYSYALVFISSSLRDPHSECKLAMWNLLKSVGSDIKSESPVDVRVYQTQQFSLASVKICRLLGNYFHMNFRWNELYGEAREC